MRNEPYILDVKPRIFYLTFFYLLGLPIAADFESLFLAVFCGIIILGIVLSGFVVNAYLWFMLWYYDRYQFKACIKVVVMEYNKECSICLDDMEADKPAVRLGCGHYFHRPCIFEWHRQSNTCPLCRVDLHAPPRELEDIRIV